MITFKCNHFLQDLQELIFVDSGLVFHSGCAFMRMTNVDSQVSLTGLSQKIVRSTQTSVGSLSELPLNPRDFSQQPRGAAVSRHVHSLSFSAIKDYHYAERFIITCIPYVLTSLFQRSLKDDFIGCYQLLPLKHTMVSLFVFVTNVLDHRTFCVPFQFVFSHIFKVYTRH